MSASRLSRAESGIDSARWFPVDLHVPRREFGFLQLGDSVLEDSPFLDSRIDAPWQQARFVAAASLPEPSVIDQDAGFLFHTSFCCSTLLASALHLPPYTVALREPLLLRRLADARWQQFPAEGLLAQGLGLLARAWHPGGKVLIKPTHVALGLMGEMVQALPNARGIMLTSTLEDFLLSNIKKSPETQAKVPELVERAMAAGTLGRRLPEEAYSPPDFLSGVALQWCAQRELLGDVLASAHGQRFRVLHDQQLLADVRSGAQACLDWLGWPVERQVLADRVAAIAGRHAKQPDRGYDAQVREREVQMLRHQFDEPVRAALRWAERLLFPAMHSVEPIKNARLL